MHHRLDVLEQRGTIMHAYHGTFVPEPLPRVEVIRAVRRLLADRYITTRQGIFARGERVGVMVGVLDAATPHAWNITVLVYGCEGQPAEVADLPVILTRWIAQGEQLMWMGHTNQNGDVSFHNMAIGVYDIRIADSAGRSGRFEVWSPGSAAVLAAGSAEPSDTEQSLQPHVYVATDNTVKATVLQTPEDALDIAFKTSEARLAQALVQFAWRTESGKVVYSHTVRLLPVKEEADLWEGNFHGTVATSEPCELVFAAMTEA